MTDAAHLRRVCEARRAIRSASLKSARAWGRKCPINREATREIARRAKVRT